MTRNQTGITLLELLLVIAIVGVLSGIGLPQYNQYMKRARIADFYNLAHARRSAVVQCYQETSFFTACSGGGATGDYPGIPADIDSAASDVVDSIQTIAGEVRVQGTDKVDNVTYVLTPSLVGDSIAWEVSGTCKDAGLCR